MTILNPRTIYNKTTSVMTFNIQLPPYLRQWLIFSMGGSIPVKFPKGSPFNAMIRLFLRNKKESERYDSTDEGAVSIFIPKFPGKDPQCFNYFPLKARAALCDMIRDAFDAQLYAEFIAFKNIGRRKKDIIEIWMEENGIEVDDRNTSAVAKRLQIVRTRIYDRDRKRKKNHVRTKNEQ